MLYFRAFPLEHQDVFQPHVHNHLLIRLSHSHASTIMSAAHRHGHIFNMICKSSPDQDSFVIVEEEMICSSRSGCVLIRERWEGWWEDEIGLDGPRLHRNHQDTRWTRYQKHGAPKSTPKLTTWTKKKVLWSDEIKIELVGHKCQRYRTVRHGGGSIVLWDCLMPVELLPCGCATWPSNHELGSWNLERTWCSNRTATPNTHKVNTAGHH